MATKIRAKLSKKNKYYISKHRYLELKHFCLQYPEWLNEYTKHVLPEKDSTSEWALARSELKKRMEMVEKAAMRADEDLSIYIFQSVTEDKTYVNLKTFYSIPCSRDTFYDRYRKFFWELSKIRE